MMVGLKGYMKRDSFFTKDRQFYSNLFHLLIVVVLQNVIAYSVNMADNIMLGAYSESALSGAATVNMIQFLYQACITALAEGVVVLSTQYWAQKRIQPIRRITSIAALVSFLVGIGVLAATSLFPELILRAFTNDSTILAEGCSYLSLVRLTYPIFALTTVFIAALRAVGTVNISFGISLMSLAVDVGLNYIFIFGKLGAPEMGIRGAAVGTLTARILELAVVLLYLRFYDKKLGYFSENPFCYDRGLAKDYRGVAGNMVASSLLWAAATPIQTGILGHLSSQAIAANSASTTLYQYLKVVTQGEAAAASVVTGQAVGCRDLKTIKAYTRTLQVIFIVIGICLSVALYFVRTPVLNLYDLSDETRRLADQLLILLCFVMAGMSYQMPVGAGIIRGGGDTRFMLIMNLISTWAIVIPLSFMAAFWWKLPVVAVVAVLNADQIFKCIPCAIRVNHYKWIRHLTKSDS